MAGSRNEAGRHRENQEVIFILQVRERKGVFHIIGAGIVRKDAGDKITGAAKYTGDYQLPGMLHACMVTSPYAHAKIEAIDPSAAWKVAGVRGIVTGRPAPLVGEEIRDRPPIAFGKVRYHGEPVAVIVADTLAQARNAAGLMKIAYTPLPVVNSPREAYGRDAPLVHENLESYEKGVMIYSEPRTNIASRTKIRKGNMEKGWTESEVTVENRISFPPSDHAAMETRSCVAEIDGEGNVTIISSSQAPFMIKRLISEYFGVESGKIVVKTPFVGGAYGGKASVQWEFICYLASKAVGGRPVKLLYSREEDILTAPAHIGLDATIKLGCSQDGFLKAAEILYLFDGGAYADKSPDLSRAGAVDCTGPYNLENLRCDSLCMYTNHPYAAPFRGFAHSEVLFAFETAMDLLARKLQMDPLELRRRNSILPGHTTPTQVLLNRSNVGDLPKCIDRLKELMRWQEGQHFEADDRKVRAKGISCVWKTSTIDSDAGSGVVLTFNPDGSLNLMTGVVEIGTGTKTVLAQILAEKMRMESDRIHVRMKVDTQTTPEHWKTVASRGTFMAGRAVLNAAEDVIVQLKDIASCILRCAPEDLEVGFERVFLRDDPATGVAVKDIAFGYKYPNGNAIGGPIIGRGHYILRHMTYLDPETGAGKPGPEWTVGAQGVEVEYDRRDYTYRLIRAVSVIDIGNVLNVKTAKGQVMGAMCMGLSFGGRETFELNRNGIILNPQLRTYRPLRYGEHPEYIVEFVETPQIDAPYGARGVGEHGLLGMPAALANALSLASGASLNRLPLLPETIWRAVKGIPHDPV